MKFTKMHGCGNDYVYVNLFEEKLDDPARVSIYVSDRHFGIGSDGLITIGPSDKADFRMRIYNADGSEAEMCGNGIRCVAKYVYDHKLTDKTEISVETGAGIKYLTLYVEENKVSQVRVDMGEPILTPGDIPVVKADGSAYSDDYRVIDEPISAGNREWHMTCVSMGNPHAVVFVDDVAGFELEKYGPLFENHKMFPKRTNTEFVEILSRNEAKMRVWERGSAETWACGTGTCATVMACILNKKTDNKVLVHLRGGDLTIEYIPETNHVFMTGPATEVFSGEIDIMESIGDPNFVYETLHYSDTNKPGYTPGADNGKYAGNGKGSKITTPGVVIDGETYHVFGINWSEGKMEWYIDDQIVRSVDYSDDPAAKAALDRPQYIQLNFATGGNWPGDAGSNLAGQTFKVEYAYYAQNQEQKAAAEKYYANTAALNVKDLSMVEGVVPDLLNEATLTAGSELVDLSEYTIDYSIDNEHMFTTNPDLNDNSQSNDQNQTKVECLIDGAASKEKIAKLAPGEYNIHYSAMHDSKPSVRKTAKLTVVEKPLLPSDMDLEGVIGNKLESIALPEGWGWVNPNMVIDTHTGEYEIIYTKVDFSNPVKVTVRATEKADVDTIAPTEKPSKDNTSVKTGDNALVATFAMLGTISLAGITLLKKKN